MNEAQTQAIASYLAATNAWHEAGRPLDENDAINIAMLATNDAMMPLFKPEVVALCEAGEQEKALALVQQIPAGFTFAVLMDYYEDKFQVVVG